MTGQCAQDVPESGFEFVDSVRLRSDITFKIYDARMCQVGGSARVLTGPVEFVPDVSPCACRTCTVMAVDEARWQAFQVAEGDDFFLRRCVVRGAVGVDEEWRRNVGPELEGRAPELVNAELVRKGYKIMEDGWIHTVEYVVVEGADVGIFFGADQDEPDVIYQYGHPALVYRPVDDVG